MLRSHYVAKPLCCEAIMLRSHYAAKPLCCEANMLRSHYVAKPLWCESPVSYISLNYEIIIRSEIIAKLLDFHP